MSAVCLSGGGPDNVCVCVCVCVCQQADVEARIVVCHEKGVCVCVCVLPMVSKCVCLQAPALGG